jgi:hypothetical protein
LNFVCLCCFPGLPVGISAGLKVSRRGPMKLPVDGGSSASSKLSSSFSKGVLLIVLWPVTTMARVIGRRKVQKGLRLRGRFEKEMKSQLAEFRNRPNDCLVHRPRGGSSKVLLQGPAVFVSSPPCCTRCGPQRHDHLQMPNIYNYLY